MPSLTENVKLHIFPVNDRCGRLVVNAHETIVTHKKMSPVEIPMTSKWVSLDAEVDAAKLVINALLHRNNHMAIDDTP